jgi:hypothetical protein
MCVYSLNPLIAGIDQMHPDDLNTVWLCRECGQSFAFHSDVESHKTEFNHSMMMLYDLRGREKTPFTRGRMSLSFRIEGKPSRIIVEYEYYPSSGAINYVDVRYSNDLLRSMVEGDPSMMRKIDSYLRKALDQKTSAGL